MMPLKTLLALACTTALLGIATVPNDQASDNPSAMDAADAIDTRSPAVIYAEYFPTSEADGADNVTPRLHRNLQTNPVFVTDSRSPSDPPAWRRRDPQSALIVPLQPRILRSAVAIGS